MIEMHLTNMKQLGCFSNCEHYDVHVRYDEVLSRWLSSACCTKQPLKTNFYRCRRFVERNNMSLLSP